MLLTSGHNLFIMQHMYFCYTICIQAKGIYHHIQALKILLDLLSTLVGLSCRAQRTLLHSFQNMIDSTFPKGFFEEGVIDASQQRDRKHDIIHHRFVLCLGL